MTDQTNLGLEVAQMVSTTIDGILRKTPTFFRSVTVEPDYSSEILQVARYLKARGFTAEAEWLDQRTPNTEDRDAVTAALYRIGLSVLLGTALGDPTDTDTCEG